MKQTISFHNTSNYWKTRYSYAPSCMMNLNKLFFTSPQEKTMYDGRKMIWRHNDSSNGFNQFYASGEHSSPSALGVSFNGYANNRTKGSSNSSSSNKLYKSFSIEGSGQALSLGYSLFKVSNNSEYNVLDGTHSFTPLVRRGNAIYGEIGKEQALTGTNIKAIGRIRNVYRWQNMPADAGINNWKMLTTGSQEATPSYTLIPGLHVDAFGNDVPPPSSIGNRLYAFEIESFMSNHPIPATVSGGGPHQFVKFFSGRVNDNGDGMQAAPYVTTDLYTPNSGEYGVNFEESFDFGGSQDYGRFLSYGDPYTDANNSFKKGNYLMIHVRQVDDEDSQHLRFENTPGASVGGGGNGNTFEDYVYNEREVLFAMTPGSINGADPHGSFADALLVFNNANFEITSLNVEYELSEYDHGGQPSTVVRSK